MFIKSIQNVQTSTYYDRIYTIYQFIEPFLDKQTSIFEEYEAFKCLPKSFTKFRLFQSHDKITVKACTIKRSLKMTSPVLRVFVFCRMLILLRPSLRVI